MHRKLTLPTAALCGVGAMLATGGSSWADSLSAPYVVAVPGTGVQSIVPILTVRLNEGIGGYRFAGIPDGLGAYESPNYSSASLEDGAGTGAFRLYCNHELTQGQGAVRAHGGTGAFVSQW